MGLRNIGTINRQFWGGYDTFCLNCGKRRTMKNYPDGSYTIKCDCGVDVLRMYEKDENHASRYYTRRFISKNSFNKKIHDKKTLPEKLGFKLEKNGKLSK